jgi:hypothetical protein
VEIAPSAPLAGDVPVAAEGTTPRSRDKPGVATVAFAGDAPPGKTGPGKKPAGKTPPGKLATGKSDGKVKGDKGEDGESIADSKQKGGSSGYGSYGQAKKVKKKVEKVVVDEKVSPFANSPLMIAQSLLVVRQGPGHDTPLVGNKILPGSLVRVGGQESISIKEKLMTKVSVETRMHIELDGDQEPIGWVTGVSKDEVETLKLAARGFPLMRAVKSLALREGQESDSAKVGEIHKDSNVRVIETVITTEGIEKALVSRDGAIAVPVGWISTILPGKVKEDLDSASLVKTPMLTITFDLRKHTAGSLISVLQNRSKAAAASSDAPVRKKKEEGSLPVQQAGKRPKFGDTDGPTESRHLIVDKPATLKMVFNCFNAPFSVTSWTGKEHPFDKLPLEQSFDLLVKGNRKLKIGRLKLAYALNTPFLERVEFPNEWFLCEDYEVVNDGWQSAATLELEIVWGKEVATLTVQPWLGYSASIGARIMLRKAGAPSGQCATVQRILADDRIVARVDGYSKDDASRERPFSICSPLTWCTQASQTTPATRSYCCYTRRNLLTRQCCTGWGAPCTRRAHGT